MPTAVTGLTILFLYTVLGVAMSQHLPALWVAELDDVAALTDDPEGRAAVLEVMALAAHRRNEIDAGQLADMLELAEAARLYGLEAGQPCSA